MSLETFIGRDVVDMVGPVMEAIDTEGNPPDQEDSQMNNEAITTEDILGKRRRILSVFGQLSHRFDMGFLLGNISESDSSDDDDAGMDD